MVRADDDLVIDGITTTIPSGTYRIVVVKNNGSLTVNGMLLAQEIYVTNGTLTATDNVQYQAENSLIVEGTITADGVVGPNGAFGGGAGGSILLRSPHIRLFGALSARGGNGGIDAGGGGGGGYIKVFYDTLDTDPVVMSNIVGLASVTGGTRGGYRNTQNGAVGCSYFDHMPRVEDLYHNGKEAITRR